MDLKLNFGTKFMEMQRAIDDLKRDIRRKKRVRILYNVQYDIKQMCFIVQASTSLSPAGRIDLSEVCIFHCVCCGTYIHYPIILFNIE